MRTGSDRLGPFLWVFFAALASCADQRPDTTLLRRPGAADAEAPRVSVGTGREAYAPLDDEPWVPLISGIQGGFHVWASFVAQGFDTDVLHMELSTSFEGVPESLVEMAADMAVRPGVAPTGEPVLTATGWPATLFDPRCAHGKRLQLSLHVTDPATGQTAFDAHHCIVEVAETFRADQCPSGI